jgi:hypothetical protein
VGGRTVIPVDYSQMELRLLASMATAPDGGRALASAARRLERTRANEARLEAVHERTREALGAMGWEPELSNSPSTQFETDLAAYAEGDTELAARLFAEGPSRQGAPVPPRTLQALLSERVAEVMADGEPHTAKAVSRVLWPDEGFPSPGACLSFVAMLKHILEVDRRFERVREHPDPLVRLDPTVVYWRLRGSEPEVLPRTRYERMLADDG